MKPRCLERWTFLFVLLLDVAVCTLRAQPVPRFDPAVLTGAGTSVRYGSYIVSTIGADVYKINDPGVTTGKGGAWGVDMYLIRGSKKALMVDLRNDYIDGYAQDLIAPRKNAAEELRAIVYGLIGKLPLEIAITHAHPDHDGMTGAFLNRNITLWMPDGEDPDALKQQHGIDPAVYTRMPVGKEFDLGGGRVVQAYQVRGHTRGSTVYLLKKDMYLFTGDSLGSGFGQAFPTVEALRSFAEDSHKLVESLSAYSPNERYSLKVFTGHSWQNSYAGFWSARHAHVDIAWLDWRFVQDVASCADGIEKGRWLEPESGLQFVGKMEYTDAWPSAKGRAIMLYGTGTIIIPLETAYAVAGLKMPEQ